jgi:hypothetical protein
MNKKRLYSFSDDQYFHGAHEQQFHKEGSGSFLVYEV